MRTQSPDARIMERLRAQPMGRHVCEFEPADYERGRYGRILRMVRSGASFREVRDYVGRGDGGWLMDRRLYEVYVKIAKGTTASEKKYRVNDKQWDHAAAGLNARILEMAAMGFSNAEIAERARVSKRKVHELLGRDEERCSGDDRPLTLG